MEHVLHSFNLDYHFGWRLACRTGTLPRGAHLYSSIVHSIESSRLGPKHRTKVHYTHLGLVTRQWQLVVLEDILKSFEHFAPKQDKEIGAIKYKLLCTHMGIADTRDDFYARWLTRAIDYIQKKLNELHNDGKFVYADEP